MDSSGSCHRTCHEGSWWPYGQVRQRRGLVSVTTDSDSPRPLSDRDPPASRHTPARDLSGRRARTGRRRGQIECPAAVRAHWLAARWPAGSLSPAPAKTHAMGHPEWRSVTDKTGARCGEARHTDSGPGCGSNRPRGRLSGASWRHLGSRAPRPAAGLISEQFQVLTGVPTWYLWCSAALPPDPKQGASPQVSCRSSRLRMDLPCA